ncbi:ionotropic receptor 25a [Macrosteles quadrilineatus]|uniref:ionotropic receptor 25a n=1 Tax=Macrosteles quadrilineatus TaxID=74068 RepID=UPI0023E152ED|nr:ionotropic receptor 25a [Macrosteles quadrilineatus]
MHLNECVFFLCNVHLVYSALVGQSFNVLHVNEAHNTVAERAVEVALSFIRRSSHLGIHVDKFIQVTANSQDPRVFLNSLCDKYNSSLQQRKPPHVVLDTTLYGVISEAAKTFTAALGLPTVTASYGQDGDIRQWRNLDGEQQKYLVQISPPGDIIPEIIRSIVVMYNITNAGILYDNSFVVDHKTKSLLQNIPTRHIMAEVEDVESIKHQLTRFRDLDIVNYFILGKLTTIKMVLDNANANKFFSKKFTWYAITKDKGLLKCACTNATIIFIKPEPDSTFKERLANLRTTYTLTAEPEIDAVFYFDLTIRTLLAIKGLFESGEWPKNMSYVSCNDYTDDSQPRRKDLDLRKYFKQVSEPSSYANLVVESNGHSYMEFSLHLERVSIVNSQSVSAEPISTWKASLNAPPIFLKDSNSINNLSSAVTIYRVVTVLQKPFVMKVLDSNGKDTGKFQGYCIDLIDEISKMINFEYEIYVAPDNSFGFMDDNGQWNGMIKELIEKRADIALGSLAVMAERENVVDFTIPYYDLVGISILMKKPKIPTSLFKFLSVLEKDVWLCILAAYFLTSLLMWVFDRWSPYSYQNNREKYKDDEEKREFNLKECLWFCMTSLTPQGGGEAPKNLSGRLVAATWWLFGFIIIASYTANLAAFLTVSRLDTPIESLDGLSKQYKIQYAPLQGSSTMTYFYRMSQIEAKFYEIWKEMSLNDNLSEIERAKLAVWDYPVSDKYTKMWQAMKEAKLPATLDEAVQRVRDSPSSSEGFAYLGDATDIKYLQMTNCDLQMVGDEFSRKPYAIAVQQGSPLKDQFNNAILQLLNKRRLEKLKETWWNQNPEKKTCEKQDDQSDGISIHNIGGVFIVIFVGIGLACITLAFEYWWYKYRKPSVVSLPRREGTINKQLQEQDFIKGLAADYPGLQNRHPFHGFGSRRSAIHPVPAIEQ